MMCLVNVELVWLSLSYSGGSLQKTSPHFITPDFRCWYHWFVRIKWLNQIQPVNNECDSSFPAIPIDLRCLHFARSGLRHRLETPLPLLHHLPRWSWIYMAKYKVDMCKKSKREREREVSLRAHKVRYGLCMYICICIYIYIHTH